MAEMKSSSGGLARLVSALKEETGETATLVILTGASKDQTTAAAVAIADSLQLDLLRVELSQVISKFIGETEKNIDRLLDGASRSRAILFFDEADALFGKHTDEKPSDDRYDSAETTNLLRRIDAYDGIVLMIVDDAAVAREAAKRLRRASTVVVLDS